MYMMSLDNIQKPKGTMISTRFAKLKFKFAYMIKAGLWRSTGIEIYNRSLSTKPLFHQYCHEYGMVGHFAWEHCRDRSIFSCPFRMLSHVLLCSSVILLYVNCFTVALFRTLAISLNVLAVFMFCLGVSLLYVAAFRYYDCMVRVFRMGFVRSLHYSVAIQMDHKWLNVLFATLSISGTMCIIGIYLICVNVVK